MDMKKVVKMIQVDKLTKEIGFADATVRVGQKSTLISRLKFLKCNNNIERQNPLKQTTEEINLF